MKKKDIVESTLISNELISNTNFKLIFSDHKKTFSSTFEVIDFLVPQLT